LPHSADQPILRDRLVRVHDQHQEQRPRLPARHSNKLTVTAHLERA
jgi:hypothetical protein